jgi:rhamnose utilization protein RhaD (predicted bifunctional aldolase and dehydrogenase)
MSVTTRLVDLIPNDWDEAAASQATTTLDQVVFASHLLGGNRAVSNFGGGNTSAKGMTVDHVGREIPAIWVKGSGSDLHPAAP